MVQTTAMYFDSDAWRAEELDAKAADLVFRLGNPTLANAASDEIKKQSHFMMPRLIDGLNDPQLMPKAAQVLSEINKQETGKNPIQLEEWYTQWWEGWYAKNKDTLGFGADHAKWKLWYRMNKDHL